MRTAQCQQENECRHVILAFQVRLIPDMKAFSLYFLPIWGVSLIPEDDLYMQVYSKQLQFYPTILQIHNQDYTLNKCLLIISLN